MSLKSRIKTDCWRRYNVISAPCPPTCLRATPSRRIVTPPNSTIPVPPMPPKLNKLKSLLYTYI
uniref:Uncharacterized protein n=1 Tax=Romanomermis culicivorax TaxID=13658 RepID=A0A915HVF9_ROMCU